MGAVIKGSHLMGNATQETEDRRVRMKGWSDCMDKGYCLGERKVDKDKRGQVVMQ